MAHRGRPPRSSVSPWTAAEDALLGTIPDKELARQLGRSASAVLWRRRELRVPSWQARCRAARFQRARDLDLLVGTMTDKDLAAQLGIPAFQIRLRRLRLGIPAFHKRHWADEDVPYTASSG